jgi:transposase
MTTQRRTPSETEHFEVEQWPDPRKGPWVLDLHFDLVRGRYECVELRIKQKSVEREPITTSLIRALPVASAIDRAREGLAAKRRHKERRRRRQEPARQPRTGRPREIDEEHLRAVAQVYRDAFRTSRKPTKIVAETFDRSPATAARWVTRARREGFLPPTTQGKATIEDAKRSKGRKR